MEAIVIEATLALVKTPVPAVLVILGVLFMGLCLLEVKWLGGEIIVRNKGATFLLGTLFMALGLGIVILPTSLQVSDTVTDQTPTPSIAVGLSEATSTPDVSEIPPISTQPEDERIAAPSCWQGEISTYPGYIDGESHVPKDSTTIQGYVPTGQIHAITGGTARVKDISLPGGVDRGSVIILLPEWSYTVEGLNPNYNWRGMFKLASDDWKALAKVLAAQQMIPGTCSDGDGCSTIDVLAVGPEGMVEQFIERVPEDDDWDGCLPY